jgi:hypothetical protein
MRQPLHALLLAASFASLGIAQAQQYGAPAAPPAQPYAPETVPLMPPPNGPALIQLFSNLSDQPATHSGFVFDRTMMQLAQDYLVESGVDARRAAAAITSVSIDNYHFKNPAFYVPENMGQLLASYKASGWMHLVNQSKDPAGSAQPTRVITDLWLHHNGANIDALTVLRRGPQNMNVIQLTGDLRPIELLHLSGHFGIPKVDPNVVMVPEGRE